MRTDGWTWSEVPGLVEARQHFLQQCRRDIPELQPIRTGADHRELFRAGARPVVDVLHVTRLHDARYRIAALPHDVTEHRSALRGVILLPVLAGWHLARLPGETGGNVATVAMAFANVKVVALMLRLRPRWVVALTLLRPRWVVALTLLRTRWVVASMRLDALSPTMAISLTVLSLRGGGKRQRGKGNADRTRQSRKHVESPGKGPRILLESYHGGV